MKLEKLYNVLFILASLIVYLEWGGGQKMFLFQMEYDIILKSFKQPLSLLHPLIILPLMGQISLFITLFQQVPKKLLTYFGISGLSVLILFVFFIGLISLNLKIIVFSLPFLIVLILKLLHIRMRKP